jgi:hypothetical protein
LGSSHCPPNQGIVVNDSGEPLAAGRSVRWPIYLVVALVAGAFLTRVVIAVVGFTSGPTPGNVSEAKEGETWSFMQLLDYLKGRGVALTIYTSQQHAAGGPLVSVCREDYVGDRSGRVLDIQRRSSRQDAHGGANGDPSALSWGRFVFKGDAGLLRKVRQALPSEP